MELTNNMKARIIKALRVKGLTQTALVNHVGLSKSWGNKLLKPIEDGGLKTISPEQAESLEEFLGISFLVAQPIAEVSGSAAKLSRISEINPQVSSLLDQLALILGDEAVNTPRYFETKEMSNLGRKIRQICDDNEGKDGKVAREVLKLVSETK